jgi:hypothetical protein
MRKHQATPNDLLDLFDVAKTEPMKRVAEAVLQREARVYYFDRQGQTKDISELDPGSEHAWEAGWGGLSEFSGRVNDVVAKVINRRQLP